VHFLKIIYQWLASWENIDVECSASEVVKPPRCFKRIIITHKNELVQIQVISCLLIRENRACFYHFCYKNVDEFKYKRAPATLKKGALSI